ncbi:hypothetical protein RHS01_10266 [Rhizoctonia solani]|uniref:C2H2-type domain-containing protein n=1 Tax=Rhizoctonia solani TaxID=456999 RepID=A0A8H7I554_9AGAM|nr:hypothetical protein RHS01_10266 [Rhizoctonia solani]
MSAQFALDPALASNSTSSTDAAPPATAAPSSLTKTLPKEPTVANHNPNPAHYSIFPALPRWGPFPGPIFAPPGPMPMPVPMYMVPGPWHHVVNHPAAYASWSSTSASPACGRTTDTGANPGDNGGPCTNTSSTSTQSIYSISATGVIQSQSRPHSPQLKSHYPPERNKPHSTFPWLASFLQHNPESKLVQGDPSLPRSTRCYSIPHYQNPGGFGGVYTPPSHTSTDTTSAPSAHSHYSDKSLDTPTTSTGDLGRPFACGTSGCSAAFDRKSDCERHRRTHAKGAARVDPKRADAFGQANPTWVRALVSIPGCSPEFLIMLWVRRIKRPTRPSSKSDVNPMPPSPPRRMSTRKRKNMTPGVYADPSESDFEDDEGDYSEGNSKRLRGGDSDDDNHDDGMEMNGQNHIGLGSQSNLNLPSHPRKLRSFASDGRVRRPAGAFTGTDEDFANMQAVEALQAALQQIEAEKGHESVV